MLRIEFNEKLLDRHVFEIKESIDTLLAKKLKSKLCLNEKECLNYVKDNLKSILQADNNQMIVYIEHFKTYFPRAIGIPNTKEKNWKRLYKILRKDIFEKEYNNWGKRGQYGAYTFVNELGLKTCPYCNRNYTFVVNKAANENGKLRPEIDHFYPKSIYPFLAMSFYNLIPSCQICNHTKSDTIKGGLENPYDIEEKSYKITYIPDSIDFTLVENEKYNFDSFEIQITGRKSNIELFKLEELYRQHKDVVLELLIKKIFYPQSYVDELKGFGFSQDEIYRYLVCNYQKDEDLHKRPLSKLIKDISEELKLI